MDEAEDDILFHHNVRSNVCFFSFKWKWKQWRSRVLKQSNEKYFLYFVVLSYFDALCAFVFRTIYTKC